jgi:hypothetical protein
MTARIALITATTNSGIRFATARALAAQGDEIISR